MFGIVAFSVIPVKKEASHRSEVIDQLVFGDIVEIIAQQEEWLQIRHDFDGYEGWCMKQQIASLNATEFEHIQKSKKIYTSSPITELTSTKTGNRYLLPYGCELPLPLNNEIDMGFDIFNNTITSYTESSDKIESIILCTKQYLNTPYLWGGKTIFGTDCSGFTQTIFRMNGIQLPRDAYQQAELGEKIEDISLGKAGDLAFFTNSAGKITHVGILLSNTEIIHASGYVKINRIDSTGIENTNGVGYSHQLYTIRRIKKLQIK